MAHVLLKEKKEYVCFSSDEVEALKAEFVEGNRNILSFSKKYKKRTSKKIPHYIVSVEIEAEQLDTLVESDEEEGY